MSKIILSSLFLCLYQISFSQIDTINWVIDNLTEINGHSVQILGEPKIIETDLGLAVEFDGIKDGLIVDNNPLAGAEEFTVEIIFKPYSGGEVEQRFLHMQQDNDNRILIELRNNNDENWTLDTFIKSGSSSQALLDYSFVHPLDEWSHAALVYKQSDMIHYVNGSKELEGTVDYQIVNSGETSIGVRLNQVSWYKGAIKHVRVTNKALEPESFMQIEDVLNSNNNVQNMNHEFWVYPNPVSSSSKVCFKLSNSEFVKIDLLNIEGKKVKSLFNGNLDAGSKEINCDFSAISSGQYIVVLDIDGSQTSEMITIEK